jgi:acetyl esterase/lipase
MRYVLLFVFGVSLLALASLSEAGVAGKKQAKPIPPPQPLWTGAVPGQKDGDKDVPVMYVHRPLAEDVNGAAVVICPGGGYGGLAISYEGHEVAQWLNTLGITGIVLKYRHAPKYQHPIPLSDAQRALRLVRANAKDWQIDAKRVGILGFSAGGHLAASAGTHFDHGRDLGNKDDAIDGLSCRPDFMILVYPVITMTDPHTHKGSRQNLLGKEPDPKLIELMSNEKQVNAKTPPTFLAHTSEDTAVPPQNSTMFYDALVKNKVPAELHIYEKGPHGLGMDRRPDLPFSSWTKRCAAWMEGRGILKK